MKTMLRIALAVGCVGLACPSVMAAAPAGSTRLMMDTPYASTIQTTEVPLLDRVAVLWRTGQIRPACRIMAALFRSAGAPPPVIGTHPAYSINGMGQALRLSIAGPPSPPAPCVIFLTPAPQRIMSPPYPVAY